MEQNKEPTLNIKERMLLAICKPENRVAIPYTKASDGGKLHKYEVDFKVAAREAARVCSEEIEHLRQENKTLKEQQRTLYVEVNSDSLAAAHYEKEIAQLRQENERLKEKICDARDNLILGNTEAAFKSLGK